MFENITISNFKIFENSSTSSLNEICIDEFQYKEAILNVCNEIMFLKPVTFLGIALIMDIIEPFITVPLLNNKNLLRSNKFTFTKLDILFIYRVGKKMMIVLAIMFIVMQKNIIG